MNALHCQKTTKLIIEGGNDYVITVKGNQPRLLAQLKTITESQKTWERFVDIEKNRSRTTCRIVNVFIELQNIDPKWVGEQSLIQIERIDIRAGKKYLQTNYYITLAPLSQRLLPLRMEFVTHWGIENRLHWVKDVIFGEDTAPFTNYNAAINWSIIRIIAINIARMCGYDSLTKAIQSDNDAALDRSTSPRREKGQAVIYVATR